MYVCLCVCVCFACFKTNTTHGHKIVCGFLVLSLLRFPTAHLQFLSSMHMYPDFMNGIHIFLAKYIQVVRSASHLHLIFYDIFEEDNGLQVNNTAIIYKVE